MGMIFWPRSGITPYIAPHRLQLNREFGGTNAPLDIRRVRKRFQAKPQNSPITVYTFQVWTLLCKLGEEKNVKACNSNLPQLEIDMNHVLFQTASLLLQRLLTLLWMLSHIMVHYATCSLYLYVIPLQFWGFQFQSFNLSTFQPIYPRLKFKDLSEKSAPQNPIVSTINYIMVRHVIIDEHLRRFWSETHVIYATIGRTYPVSHPFPNSRLEPGGPGHFCWQPRQGPTCNRDASRPVVTP